MAVLQLTPRDEVFRSVESLTGIARLLLDIRIVLGLLVTVWLALGADVPVGVLLGTSLAMGWLLFVLLRWHTVGWVLCTHPALLAVDALLCFVALGATTPLSPVLLLLGAGALFTGVCLDRRGARYLSPLYVGGWWLVFSAHVPDRASAADVFWQLLLVPSLLVGALFLGAGIRSVVLRGADVERRLREEVRAAGVAEERARMAREMHDSLTKSMHGLAMLADSLPAWIERAPEQAADQSRQLATLIRNAGQESRQMILAMRRADARATPAQQVTATVERWRSTSGRPAVVEVTGRPDVPTETGYELVAILGEALENVSRHTPQGTTATVRLEQQDSWVVLSVTDDGPGMEERHRAGKEGHFGVLGMHERAARVGGQLGVVTRPGAGTRVEARLPASLEMEPDAELAVGARVVNGSER